jgi:hypothetical protein
MFSDFFYVQICQPRFSSFQKSGGKGDLFLA